jgi:VanZ family protein
LGMYSFPKKNLVIFLIIFTLYGILIEFLQEYMKVGRTFEYSDMLADFIGCLLGMITIRIFLASKKQ